MRTLQIGSWTKLDVAFGAASTVQNTAAQQRIQLLAVARSKKLQDVLPNDAVETIKVELAPIISPFPRLADTHMLLQS